MKVIIQDIGAREFLGADGQWVSDKEDARDFFTLLHAYHFAQANTSIHFRVLLHCPEDDYSASIIEGIGTAGEEASIFRVPIKKASVKPAKQPVNPALLFARTFATARVHLN
ncbi:MAG TPA: hypothetical protein VG754_02610 [Verrucomicrobiae bacterium]|jgi:hypothetical protein|nr:hypothetical protein [Verrucomicrobiae bacterium]